MEETNNTDEGLHIILAGFLFDQVEDREKSQEELERMLFYARKNVEKGYFAATVYDLEDLVNSIREDRIDFNALVPTLIEQAYLTDRVKVEGNSIVIEPVIEQKGKSVIDASRVRKEDVINAFKEAYLVYLISSQILLYGAKERAEQLGKGIKEKISDIESIALRIFSKEDIRYAKKTAIIKRIRTNAYLGERGFKIAQSIVQKYAAELKSN